MGRYLPRSDHPTSFGEPVKARGDAVKTRGADPCYLRLQDQMEQGVYYHRDGDDLQSRGLYLDALPWQTSVFALTRTS